MEFLLDPLPTEERVGFPGATTLPDFRVVCEKFDKRALKKTRKL